MMRNRSIADLSAALTWDLDDFERGTADIDKGFDRIIDGAQEMGNRFRSLGKDLTYFLTIPIVGSMGGVAAMAGSTANEIKAMGNSARLAGEDIEKFQRQSHAARSVGIEYEKLGDIFKDTRDKIGDFAASGGGEMADFFEKIAPRVGVTIDQFQELSGKDALQLYFDSLTKANVSSAEMVFYLEAIADEASGLIPLLEKNGAEFERLGKSAPVFTPEQIAVLERYRAAMREIGFSMKRIVIAVVESGLLDTLTNLIERVAGFITRLSQTNPVIIRWIGYIALAVAAIGPLVAALTVVAIVVLPLFLARLSPVFLILSALINPIGTLVVFLGKLAGGFRALAGGLTGALKTIGRLIVLLARLHPVATTVITIFTLFGDKVTEALGKVWERAQETIGPALERLFDSISRAASQLRAAFNELARSELGQWIDFIIEKLGDLLAALVLIAGDAVVTAISIVIDLINTIVVAVADVVKIVYRLLTGDWAGAWDAARDAVTNMIANLFPAFQNLWGWIKRTLIEIGVMEGEIEEATSDRSSFGGSDSGQKRRSSFGGAGTGGGSSSAAPDRRSLFGKPYSSPSEKKASSPRRTRKAQSAARTGPTAEELAARREEIRLEQELNIARARGDLDEIRALERKQAIRRQAKRYEDAGLKAAAALAAAERDILALEDVKRVVRSENLEARNLEIELQEAQMLNDGWAIQELEREKFLIDTINDLQREGFELAVAEKIAREELLRLDGARAEVNARRLRDERLARDLELARLRGDSESVALLEDRQRLNDRVEELRGNGLTDAEAIEQATEEGVERAKASMQGSFRDAFRGGLQAALDGDLAGFFKRWLQDASFDALAKVLDRLADRLANLVFGDQQSGGSGLGGILNAIGGLFGPGNSTTGVTAFGSHEGAHSGSIPGFNSGGSFQIRGLAGVDRNILSLNNTPIARVSNDEIINVKRPSGNTSGKLDVTVAMDPSTGQLGAFVRDQSGQMIAAAAPAIASDGAQQGVDLMFAYQNQRLD